MSKQLIINVEMDVSTYNIYSKYQVLINSLRYSYSVIFLSLCKYQDISTQYSIHTAALAPKSRLQVRVHFTFASSLAPLSPHLIRGLSTALTFSQSSCT